MQYLQETLNQVQYAHTSCLRNSSVSVQAPLSRTHRFINVSQMSSSRQDIPLRNKELDVAMPWQALNVCQDSQHLNALGLLSPKANSSCSGSSFGERPDFDDQLHPQVEQRDPISNSSSSPKNVSTVNRVVKGKKAISVRDLCNWKIDGFLEIETYGDQGYGVPAPVRNGQMLHCWWR